MEKHTCAYCGSEVDPKYAWKGPNTGSLYCPDVRITECLATFGRKVGTIDCTYYPPQPQLAGAAA